MTLEMVQKFIIVRLEVGSVDFFGLVFAAGHDEKLFLVCGYSKGPNLCIVLH